MNTTQPRFEGHAATTNGVRLYYRRLGSGPKTVVIPGAAWWATQADALADRVNLVLYDTRGRGRSDRIIESTLVGIDQDLADLDSLRSHLGLERVSLIGWSYLGAMVALYAAAHPEAVDRLVQVGPLGPRKAPHWDDWMADFACRAAKCAEHVGFDSAFTSDGSTAADSRQSTEVRNGLLALVRPQLADPSAADTIVDAVGADVPNENPDALAKLHSRTVASLGSWDFRPSAALVKVPVLTILGSEDSVSLASCLEWVTAFGDARLLRMQHVGHYPFYERPGEFIAAVAEFLVDERWPLAAEKAPV